MEPDVGTHSGGRLDSTATHDTMEHEKMVGTTTSSSNAGSSVPRARTTVQRALAHVKRHKWPYIIGSVVLVILAIGLPVIFAYYIPHAIQHAIDSNSMPIRNGTISVVSPTEVRLGMTSELENPRKETVRLSAFPLELRNPDSADHDPIVTLPFPEVTLHGHQTTYVTVDEQTLPVQSAPELTAFLKRTYSEKDTTMAVHGAPQAHLGSLSYGMKLDQSVDLTGLGGLADMKITSMVPVAADLKANPNNNISTMSGNITVTNPSVFTLNLGDVHFAVSSGGVTVGESWVKGLSLVPGPQTIFYEGELYVDQIVDKQSNWTNFKKLVSTMDDDGRVHFDIAGMRSWVGGEPVGYLDDVVSQIQLKMAPCFLLADKAIPPKKKDFAMMKLFSYSKAMECDEKAPFPDV